MKKVFDQQPCLDPVEFIEFIEGPFENPNSVAKKCRSMPRAFPAIAPEPNGHHLWLSIDSNRIRFARNASA